VRSVSHDAQRPDHHRTRAQAIICDETRVTLSQLHTGTAAAHAAGSPKIVRRVTAPFAMSKRMRRVRRN
jgi:hypothetical protein